LALDGVFGFEVPLKILHQKMEKRKLLSGMATTNLNKANLKLVAHLVNNWITVDPHKAMEIIEPFKNDLLPLYEQVDQKCLSILPTKPTKLSVVNSPGLQRPLWNQIMFGKSNTSKLNHLIPMAYW
jgi:hypothetical protein